MKKIFRMSKEESKKLREVTAERKARLGARKASIVAFAVIFGKDLLNYNSIRVGRG